MFKMFGLCLCTFMSDSKELLMDLDRPPRTENCGRSANFPATTLEFAGVEAPQGICRGRLEGERMKKEKAYDEN